MRWAGERCDRLGGARKIMDADTLRVARDKLTRVFRYLEALNQHRNPARKQIREQLWTLWLKDLPDHPSIRRGAPRQRDAAETPKSNAVANGASLREERAFLVKVLRPRLTSPPTPPKELESWLERGWEDPSKEISLRAAQNQSGEHGQTKIIRFDDDPQRRSASEAWKQQRDTWAKNEKPARASMKLFETLYDLYGRREREAERVELVLGDGILSWRRQEGGIYHPILLQRLQLEFNASVPEFTLSGHALCLTSAITSAG